MTAMNQFTSLGQSLSGDQPLQLLEASVVGTSSHQAGTQIEVRVGAEHHQARRAAGCLLAPLPGDLVLLVKRSDQSYLVLTVLLRETGAAANLDLPGAASLQLSAEELRLSAEERIDVKGDRLDVSCRAISFKSKLLALAVDAIDAFARRLESHVQQRRSSSRELVEECDVAIRRVRGVDTQSARQLVLRAEETLITEAENTVVVARKHVRVDGEQISMG
ncbi:MAG: DUF3540 domain-containing protein [Pseudomonadota bacterium]